MKTLVAQLVNFRALLGTTLLMSACSHVEMRSPDSSSIELKDQAWVKVANQEASLMKRGETIDISTEPVLIEAPGKVGVLVLPVNTEKSKTEVKLRPIQNWAGDAAQAYAATMVSDVLAHVNEVQTLMATGRARDALNKVRSLQEQYPKVTYLKFVEASCLILLGDRQNARTILEDALIDHPSNTQAQKVLRELASEGAR